MSPSLYALIFTGVSKRSSHILVCVTRNRLEPVKKRFECADSLMFPEKIQ